MKLILIFLPLFILGACGKGTRDADDRKQEEVETFDGTYSAILIPFNGSLSSDVHGDVKIVKFGDDFSVDVELKNAPPGIHKQGLHTGSECPKLSDDVNGDGIVDHYESMKITGPIIVPFDGNLSAQEIGEGSYPSGSYHYHKSTSYFLMLSDLHLLDDVSNDSLVKLLEKDLPLEKRVVMIYSRNKNTVPTVTGKDVPIACGVLTQISDSREPEDASWEDDVPRRPRRDDTANPRPRPSPPTPQNDEIEAPRNPSGGWWDRLRERWNRWRNRWNPNPENAPQNPN